MKTYNIEIVRCNDEYYILDFTITRPVITKEIGINEAVVFARGYKMGIQINSYNKFSPKITNIIDKDNIEEYIKQRKKYYTNLWEVEDEI